MKENQNSHILERMLDASSKDRTSGESQYAGSHDFVNVGIFSEKTQRVPWWTRYIELSHDYVVRMLVRRVVCFIEYEKADVASNIDVPMTQCIE